MSRSGLGRRALRRAAPGGKDRAAAQGWMAQLAASSPEVVEQAVRAAGAEALDGVRALGAAGGVAAIPLLRRLASGRDVELAIAAAEALGDVAAAAAADVLKELTEPGRPRPLRDAARRSLHRLKAAGVRPAEAERPGGIVQRPSARLYRAVASAFDGRGDRQLWLAAERPLGGVYVIGLMINAADGLIEVSGRETTRRRFAEQERTMREGDSGAWVELPPDYARQLVREAAELAREAGRPIPPQYAVWASLIEAEQPVTQALVYQRVSPLEAKLHPTLLYECPQLFVQPEVGPWLLPPERVAKWARQLAEPPSQRLVITPESEEARRERLLREAAAELFSPRDLRALRRRLEETAYILLMTDREEDARRAVAAAATIEEPRPLDLHPFVRALLRLSIEAAMPVGRPSFEPVRFTRSG